MRYVQTSLVKPGSFDEEARVAFPNRAPDASVSYITPNLATQAQTITFTGTGSDSDGSVVEYKWLSSLSGVIGTSTSFTKNDTPVGTHNTYFSVRDDSGAWSQEVLAVVVVNAPATDDPTYRSVQNASSLLNTLMIVRIVTLLAAVAAVVIAGYSMMSRKKAPSLPSA